VTSARAGRRIVADVGGTRCRFAISAGPGELDAIQIYATAGQPSFAEALKAYVADLGADPIETWCAGVHLAAAGPIDQGAVQLTNAAWFISSGALSEQIGGVPVSLANDLEAVGLLLPHLQSPDIATIGDVSGPRLTGNRIAINVGTGFGAATAVRGSVEWLIAAGEAGHMSLAPATPEEAALLGWGRTIEDFLSGAGIARLHAAHDTAGGERSAEAIFASSASDAAAARTSETFSRLLGRVTGDLVLATAAWDGAYLCGSVARAWLEVADVPAFRAAFEDKGLRAHMARVPTYAITVPEPALLGLTYAAPPAA
jgi:glucokinase